MAQTHSTEFLELLNESLKFAPERGDIWMMRFDAMRSLGLKKEGDRVKAKKLVLAPIRSAVHTILSTSYRIIGRSQLAKQHQQTSRYWTKYLLTYISREQQGRRRIAQLDQSLAVPQWSASRS